MNRLDTKHLMVLEELLWDWMGKLLSKHSDFTLMRAAARHGKSYWCCVSICACFCNVLGGANFCYALASEPGVLKLAFRSVFVVGHLSIFGFLTQIPWCSHLVLLYYPCACLLKHWLLPDNSWPTEALLCNMGNSTWHLGEHSLAFRSEISVARYWHFGMHVLCRENGCQIST